MSTITTKQAVPSVPSVYQVEIYAGPRPDGYSACVAYKPGESVPVVVEGREVGRIAVTDILPPKLSAGGNGA